LSDLELQMEPLDTRPAWWAMRCDRNHAWWRLVPGDSEPSTQDLTCPVAGDEAVTSGRRQLADRVLLHLVPAAREFEGSIGFGDEYFLELSDHAGRNFLRSAHVFSYEEARKRMTWFRGLAWPDAERRWHRSGMSEPDDLKMRSMGTSG
jgi:hypothetical protein